MLPSWWSDISNHHKAGFQIMQTQTDKGKSKVIVDFCAVMQVYFCSTIEFLTSMGCLLIIPATSQQERCSLNTYLGKTVGFMFSYSDAFIISIVFANQVCLGCLKDLKVDHEVGHHQ